MLFFGGRGMLHVIISIYIIIAVFNAFLEPHKNVLVGSDFSYT